MTDEEREIERNHIEEQTRVFLANGGMIISVPFGISTNTEGAWYEDAQKKRDLFNKRMAKKKLGISRDATKAH